MRLRRDFDLDSSCKLWFPFYKYGAEQSKIWDQSGNNNHGTITGAVPYPGNPQRTSVGSTFNRGDFTATNAFFWSSLNLSLYAGTDLGYTPFKIEVLDAAGKKATGYIGAVGAGETLGSELIINRTFDTGANWVIAEGSWVFDGTANISGAVQDVIYAAILTLDALYKGVYDIASYTQGTGRQQMGAWGIGNQNSALGTYVEYKICAYNIAYYLVAIANSILSFDNPSVKRITDPPSTAVHIVSSLNGTTRNWASIESGFDPNAIASWMINKVAPEICIGWYFDDVNDLIAHPSINFGKTHTLLYWIRSFANAKDIIHGGAANYHVAIDGTNLYYNAGATELSQAHGGGMGNPIMIGVVRSGTTVQFFKNGIQVGSNQTLDANNDLTLTTIGSYDTPGTCFGGVALEDIGFNRALSAQEIRNYYELTRFRYGG